MGQKLQNKVAVVTGAGTGIGQAIAIGFAQEGATVVIDYVGAASAAEETVGKLAAGSGEQPGGSNGRGLRPAGHRGE